MANVFRKYHTGRLTSQSLYKQRKGDAVQNIANEFFEVPSSTTPYVISTNTTGIYANNGLSSVEDLKIRELDANTNFAGSTTHGVVSWVVGDREHSLYRFNDLSTIGAGTITNAEFGVYVVGGDGGASDVQIRALKRLFNSTQATWNIFATGNNWQTAGALGANDIGSVLDIVTSTGGTGYWLQFSGTALDSWVSDCVAGIDAFEALYAELTADTAYGNQYEEFTSSAGTDGQRPYLKFDWVAPSVSVVDGVGSSKSAFTANATGVKVATGVGASNIGTKSSASGSKIGQSRGESKVGSTANAIGQAGSVVSSIGASNNGINNSAAGFKVASGIGSSRAGVDNSASGSKTAQSNGSSNLGIDSSVAGVKTAVSQSSTKIGIDSSASGYKIASSNSSAKVGFTGSASGAKTAQGSGASKIGSAGNSIGTSSAIASSIGASDVGFTGSASGAKTAQSVGDNKQGTKASAAGFKVASSVGSSKTGAKGSAAGAVVAIQSGIGTSKLGLKSSVSGTKTTQSIGASKQATASNATGFKIAVGVGSCKAGVKSTPAGELYIPTIPKKITNYRGPEWITVSQSFWSS